MIQPRCKENGARRHQYSTQLTGKPSVFMASPRRHPRMASMSMSAKGITSWANAKVQQTWHAQAAHHQGETTLTSVLLRKRGSIWAAVKTASQMKMGPQMLNAQPSGVTKVWYLSLNSVFVAPKMPVRDVYVTTEFKAYAATFNQFRFSRATATESEEVPVLVCGCASMAPGANLWV